MSGVKNKLMYLMATKSEIGEALRDKQQQVLASDTFRSYADKIRAIGGSGSGSPGSAILDGKCQIANICDMVPHTGYVVSCRNYEDASSIYLGGNSAHTSGRPNRTGVVNSSVEDKITEANLYYQAFPIYGNTLSSTIESPIGSLVVAAVGHVGPLKAIPAGWELISQEVANAIYFGEEDKRQSVKSYLTVLYTTAISATTSITVSIPDYYYNKIGINMHVFNTSLAPQQYLSRALHLDWTDYDTADPVMPKCQGATIMLMYAPQKSIRNSYRDFECDESFSCNDHMHYYAHVGYIDYRTGLHYYDNCWWCADDAVQIQQNTQKFYRWWQLRDVPEQDIQDEWSDHNYGPYCKWQYTHTDVGSAIDTRYAATSYRIDTHSEEWYYYHTEVNPSDMHTPQVVVGLSIPVEKVVYDWRLTDDTTTHWYVDNANGANYVVRVTPNTRYLLYAKKPGNYLGISAWTGDPTSEYEVVRGDVRTLYETNSPEDDFIFDILIAENERYLNIYYTNIGEEATIYVYPLSNIDSGSLTSQVSHPVWTGGTY